jgi:hypothetical protein
LLENFDDLFVMYTDKLIQITGIFENDFYLDMILKFSFNKEKHDKQKQPVEKDYMQFR